MLSKLGLRADEVATLTLDDIDWRAGEMILFSSVAQAQSAENVDLTRV